MPSFPREEYDVDTPCKSEPRRGIAFGYEFVSGGSDERLLGSAIRDYMLISGEPVEDGEGFEARADIQGDS